MPKPYPREFRDDVVRVARDREPGVTIEQIANGLRGPPDDFAEMVAARRDWTSFSCSSSRIRLRASRSSAASVLVTPGLAPSSLRRAAAYLSQANLPGKGSTRS